MQENPRRVAVTILNRVDREKSFAEPLLDTFLSKNTLATIQDRRLLTEIVYGTLRMRNRIDWLIQSLYRGDSNKMERGIKNILRVGLYQIMFTDRIPGYAAVDEAVKLAKRDYPGRDGLVNAILRAAIRNMNKIKHPDINEHPLSHISLLHSHPAWLVEKWTKELGTEDTIELCRSNNERPLLTLRINRLKTGRTDTLKELHKGGFTVRPTEYSPDGIIISNPDIPVREITLFKKGHILIQDEASQLISLMLDPKPEDMVLDVCSGTGIKTTHMAGLMKNRGKIVALDINKKKIERLEELSRRFGATIIEPRTADATKDMESPYRERFDRILVDVPCSALGTLRRNPEIKWNKTVKDMEQFPRLQKKILNLCAGYLKPGGTMLYATCTIEEDENEKVVEDFLRAHPGFRCIPSRLPETWKMTDGKGFFKTFPHRHGTDGFFGALLIKKKKGE
jgi:16S rRNA (cytosine967-C5)-methyltransferase